MVNLLTSGLKQSLQLVIKPKNKHTTKRFTIAMKRIFFIRIRSRAPVKRSIGRIR